jgi:UPF0716 protein FxsA
VLPRLGCLFIVVPLIELALLIQVGRWVGVWPTIALVAVTGLAGMVLVRHEGIRTLARVQTSLARGEVPGRALMDAACLLVSGALLVTPGVLTDVFAFALLVPPTRRWLQERALGRFRGAISRGTVQFEMGAWPGRWGARGPGGGRAGGAGEARRPGPAGPQRDDPRHGPGPGDDDEPPRPPRPGEIIQE